jgi:hypothetical protein
MAKSKNTLVQTKNEKKHIAGGYVIPSEVADGIAVAVMKEYRGYMQHELDRWRADPKSDNNPNGYWMHPEDVGHTIRRIDALNLLIKDFGG